MNGARTPLWPGALLLVVLSLLALGIGASLPARAQASAGSAPAAPSEAETLDQAWSRWPQDAPTPEQVMYLQPRLMDQAIARLKPQHPGRIDLYLISFAGDGSEDVFGNEAEYAAKLFAQRFGARGHTLVLANDPRTLDTTPLATWTNLETALAAVHRVMDPKQDILMLYLTSHGSEDPSLLVDMDPLPLDQIGAQDLAGILREQHFDWKVLVLNACYSGGFVPALRGAGTLVMTAARADRSSFGCGSESQITYFGDAFLAKALNRDDDLISAFGRARGLIASWENRDHLPHSDPQIDTGPGIAAHLARWRQGLGKAAAPLAFRPAASP